MARRIPMTCCAVVPVRPRHTRDITKAARPANIHRTVKIKLMMKMALVLPSWLGEGCSGWVVVGGWAIGAVVCE
jgi:hypothetical protein